MNQRTVVTLTTFGALGVVAGLSFMLPDHLSVPQASAAAGDQVRLNGVVRDFSASHPDFARLPDNGAGQYAGNVGHVLSAGGRPMFAPMSDRVTNFTLTQKTVVPATDFAVQATVLGAAINSGSYHRPVTLFLDIGGERFEPFGPFAQPVEGSVNDDQSATGWVNPGANPRIETVAKTFAAGTSVAVTGKSWNLNSGSGLQNGDWGTKKVVSTGANDLQVEVLVHGDPAPTFIANAGQESAEAFVKDYIDFDTDTMDLGSHQVILLYELAASTGGDFQDLVVLLSFADDPSFFNNGKIGGSTTAMLGGFRVDDLWRDASGNHIAPHLAQNDGPGVDTVRLGTAPTTDRPDSIDSYDSSQGPYGGGNVDDAPELEIGATLEPVVPPAGLPWQNHLWYGGHGTSTLSGDFHCDEFWLWNQHTLRIDGTVRVVVDSVFQLENFSRIELLPGARLEVYALGTTFIKDHSHINANTADPTRVVIHYLGTSDMELSNNTSIYASVFAPFATLRMQNTGDLYGRFEGLGLSLENSSAYHHDRQPPPRYDTCGNLLADLTGLAGPNGDGAITSSASFAQWFRDVPGVNLSKRHPIVLERDGAGIWSYMTNAFYPIDNRLEGNEGDDHNTNFTYAFTVDCTYSACTAQFFEFEGGDGVWVFIDGRLAIDLGGVGASDAQRVDLDRMDLTDGETYKLRFFYAQRNGANGRFRLRTNLDLGQRDEPVTISGVFD